MGYEILLEDTAVEAHELPDYLGREHFINPKIRLRELTYINKVYHPNLEDTDYREIVNVLGTGDLNAILDFVKRVKERDGDDTFDIMNSLLSKIVNDILKHNLGYKLNLDNVIEDLPDLKVLLNTMSGSDQDYEKFLSYLAQRLKAFAKSVHSSADDPYCIKLAERRACGYASSLFDVPSRLREKESDDGSFEVSVGVPLLDCMFKQHSLACRTGIANIVMLDKAFWNTNIRKYSVYLNSKTNKYVFVREFA